MTRQCKQAHICPWQLAVLFQHCGSLAEGIALISVFSGDSVSRKETLPTCTSVAALSITAVLWALGAKHVMVS